MQAELLERRRVLRKGAICQHYEGNLYRILFLGRGEEDSDDVVIYQELSEGRAIWSCPVERFLGDIEQEGKKAPRFTFFPDKNAAQKRLFLYLAGNIQKSHENSTQLYWTKTLCDHLRAVLSPVEVSFFNPAIRSDDLTDQKSVFGRDITQVFCSHALFVDARERRGLGVGAEIMWAKMQGIAVIILAPENSHYRKSEVRVLDALIKNWVHPFVLSLSDAVVNTVEEGAFFLQEWLLGKKEIKGAEVMEDAMRYYQKTQMQIDIPMRKMFEKYASIREKITGL